MFTTGVDNQTGVDIHVLQGERELAADCRSLAHLHLRGIPAMPAGLPRIEVRFQIDANGILSVGARELRTGIEQTIEVKPSYGLTEGEVERMLIDSFEHAEADFEARLLIEEQDEYLRSRFIHHGLIATGFVLAITTAWGFLEQFNLVSHVASYWVFPAWVFCVGLSQCWAAVKP